MERVGGVQLERALWPLSHPRLHTPIPHPHPRPQPLSQSHNYHGEAINPRHLSRYERWRGYGLFYMAERDKEHKRIQLSPHQ